MDNNDTKKGSPVSKYLCKIYWRYIENTKSISRMFVSGNLGSTSSGLEIQPHVRWV